MRHSGPFALACGLILLLALAETRGWSGAWPADESIRVEQVECRGGIAAPAALVSARWVDPPRPASAPEAGAPAQRRTQRGIQLLI